MLTLERLKSMEPETVFAHGVELDSSKGINLANTGKKLRWIAIRGGIHDWTIYAHFADKDVDWIQRYGDKIHSEHNIKKLVPCDDEAFSMYRH